MPSLVVDSNTTKHSKKYSLSVRRSFASCICQSVNYTIRCANCKVKKTRENCQNVNWVSLDIFCKWDKINCSNNKRDLLSKLRAKEFNPPRPAATTIHILDSRFARFCVCVPANLRKCLCLCVTRIFCVASRVWSAAAAAVCCALLLPCRDSNLATLEFA